MQSWQYVGAAFAVVAFLWGILRIITRPRYPVSKVGIIVVSGASTGIGRDAALEFDKRGFHVRVPRVSNDKCLTR
jgi:hypothetical protein